MTFFAQRVFYELSVVKVYDSQPIFLLIFLHNRKKQGTSLTSHQNIFVRDVIFNLSI